MLSRFIPRLAAINRHLSTAPAAATTASAATENDVVVTSPASVEGSPLSATELGVLSPSAWNQFALVDKRRYNHNTFVFRFALPSESDRLGLPVGSHFFVRAEIEGKNVTRPYTPISTEETRGYFELLVKIYEKGKMSQHLANMLPGQKVEVKGPTGRFRYQPNAGKFLCMIAGGTGITPMYQILQAIVANPDDQTSVALLFGNVTEQDVLLEQELLSVASQRPNIRVVHVIERPAETWTGARGFINRALLEQHMPVEPAAAAVEALLCGPPGLIMAMRGHLQALGLTDEQIFKF